MNDSVGVFNESLENLLQLYLNVCLIAFLGVGKHIVVIVDGENHHRLAAGVVFVFEHDVIGDVRKRITDISKLSDCLAHTL